jgi:uncharacterized protein YjdB
MIIDNLYNFTEQYNGEGLYWNYWYHVWKTFSISPFAQSVVFVPGTPSVTSITISPSTATVSAGQIVLFSADVATENFASKAVTWTLSAVDSDSAAIEDLDAYITVEGELHIGASIESGTVITVTATSVYDSTVTSTATVTVS